MNMKKLLLIPLLLLTVLSMAACGGGDPQPELCIGREYR